MLAEASNADPQALLSLERATNEITTLRAELTQTRFHTSIGGHETWTGVIYIDRTAPQLSDAVIVRYKTGEMVFVKGEEITVYGPKHRPMIRSDATLSLFASMYRFNAQKAQDLYDIGYPRQGQPAVGPLVLELTQKPENGARRMRLWIDPKLWLPAKLELGMNDGDRMVMEIGNVELGGEIQSEILSHLSATRQ